MELHIIFLNQKYPTIDEAFLNKDGVTVIGRFFEATPNAHPPVFGRYLKQLLTTSETVAECGIPLSQLSPSINFNYASYKGSLTAPICREVVTWIVAIDKNLEISNKMIDRFRRLVTEESVVRKVQPLNGRVLTCRFR
jgi:carbonic anhydrase